MTNFPTPLPNLIYIGPDKSGSSWLYEFLRVSDEAYVPECKDLYFFDRYFDRGIDWYSSHYERAAGKIIADISHDYLFSKVAARRIKEYLSDVTLLTFLRSPVDRSFSQFLYMKKMGLVTGDFLNAVRQRPEIIENSLYAEHLMNYDQFTFGRDLKVFLFEDLQANPERFAIQLARSLSINVPEKFDPSEKVRVRSASRNIFITRLLKKLAVYLRENGFETLLGRLKRSPMLDTILFKTDDDLSDLSVEMKAHVYKTYFSRSVDNLEKMLGLKLDVWRYSWD